MNTRKAGIVRLNGSAHKSPLVFLVIEDGVDGVVTNGTQGFCNGSHVELSVHY